MANNKILGDYGEEPAIKHLKKNNYKILERNYRCKLGEIDVIAQNNNFLVFLEIKTRRNANFGFPCEAVDYHKQQRIIKIAQYYLMFKNMNYPVRFDVVEVIAEIKGNKFHVKDIELIRDAFSL